MIFELVQAWSRGRLRPWLPSCTDAPPSGLELRRDAVYKQEGVNLFTPSHFGYIITYRDVRLQSNTDLKSVKKLIQSDTKSRVSFAGIKI